MATLFLWRRDSVNLGDRHSGWMQHHTFVGRNISEDIDAFEARRMSLKPYQHVIIGGGLMPDWTHYPHTCSEIERYGERVWAVGVGTNCNPTAAPKCARILWRHGRNATPCPSCRHPAFQAPPPPTHGIVYYENPNIATLDGVPKRDNVTGNFRDAIDHIASGGTVVTSSYHGAYWASLMGRKIVVIGDRRKFRLPCWEQVPGWSLWSARIRASECAREIRDWIGSP